jgi:hypothetical protein
MIAIIFSMPFIPGQTPGLIAGILMIALFTCCYLLQKKVLAGRRNQGEGTTQRKSDNPAIRDVDGGFSAGAVRPQYSAEYGKELAAGKPNQKKGGGGSGCGKKDK